MRADYLPRRPEASGNDCASDDRKAAEDAAAISELMAALADPKRVLLLRLLRSGEMNGLALAEALDVSPRNVSHHLAVLYRARILSRRREGREALYAIQDWTASWLIEQAGRALADPSHE